MGWRNRWIQFGHEGEPEPPKRDGPTEGPVEDSDAQDARTHQRYDLDGRRWVRPVNCRCTQFTSDHT